MEHTQLKMMEIVENIRQHYDSEKSIQYNLNYFDNNGIYWNEEAMLLYIDIYELYDLED